MIDAFATPAVCLVDDEEQDYTPILTALNQLYVGCVHFVGNDIATLPAQPFTSLRLIFMDLHLNGTSGKNAASHSANVFRRLVSASSAPVVVVIWSKYADEAMTGADMPTDDQPSEAELFQRTLIEAEPKYEGRLIFVRMHKPKKNETRPEQNTWIAELKGQIQNVLADQNGIKALLDWEQLVRQCSLGVSGRLTDLSKHDAASINEQLMSMMRSFCIARQEGDLSSVTSTRHLASVLGQLLADELEHCIDSPLGEHGEWLTKAPNTALSADFASKVNTLLLTSELLENSALFLPGTIYQITDTLCFEEAFGCDVSRLVKACFNGKEDDAKWNSWKDKVEPVLIELSPTCDVANNKRTMSTLVAGLLVPADLGKRAQSKDAYKLSKQFVRRPSSQSGQVLPRPVVLVLCAGYKLTLPVHSKPSWLKPNFRTRELQTTDFRDWIASNSSRVGVVAL